jgi:hypothetical protein
MPLNITAVQASKKEFSDASKKPDSGQIASHDDAYTVRNDHFVGHDGFIVPNSFSEFYQRFLTYVADWVRRRVRGCNRRLLHSFATSSRGIEFPP